MHFIGSSSLRKQDGVGVDYQFLIKKYQVSIPNWHEVPLDSRRLIAMAHRYDDSSPLSLLPVPLLHEIFKYGLVPILQWKWADTDDMKAKSIAVDEYRAVASRQGGGTNPAIFASQPLTYERPNFRIKVTELGEWVGIGFSALGFTLDGGVTLGTQSGVVNCAYFFQSSGIHQVQAGGETEVLADPIAEGDIIDIYVEFANQRVWVTRNNKLQGCLCFTDSRLVSGKIYPCVDMSVKTSVLLVPCEIQHQSPREVNMDK